MVVEYQWKSNICGYITGYLGDMRATGYKYKRQERMLRQFDQYCYDHNIGTSGLSREAVEGFCHGDDYEAQATKEIRTRLIRNLAGYMRRASCPVYVPPSPLKTFRYPRHEPYIYSEKELESIFSQIDSWQASVKSHSNRKKADPLLFRMLYGCGLRITEALKLKVSDVDMEEGILRICQAKNNKDRFVPMAPSLTARCRDYHRAEHCFSMPDSYFFPGQHGECYDKSTIYRRFRQYLWKAGISHSGNGPRIHDFRHAYCVHRLKKWVLEGKELTNLMPYLAVYLGHSDFRGTEYYLRLTVDLYPDIIAKMEVASGYIIPEKGDNDEAEGK